MSRFHLDGSQAVFSFETPFSIIGDLELFDESQIVGNVQALEDSYIFAASATKIKDCGYNDVQFLRFLNHYLVKKLHFSSILLSQTTLSLDFRVAQYLLHRQEIEGHVLQLEKRALLAAMLGTSTRHLNRTLRRLVDTKTIEVHNKRLTIVNCQALSAITKRGT